MTAPGWSGRCSAGAMRYYADGNEDNPLKAFQWRN